MTDTTMAPGAQAYALRRYTAGAIALHWIIAVLIIGQIVGGLWMVSAAYDSDASNDILAFNAYQLHKTFGILVLLATAARVAWRVMNPPPASPPAPAWQEAAARGVHLAFYGLMIIIPLTGWLMVSVSPREVPTLLFNQRFLAWPHLPGFGGLSESVRESLESALIDSHKILAFATVGLLFLHVGAALKHQFIDRDNLLACMTPGLSGAEPPARAGRGGAIVAALILAPLALGVGLGRLGASASDSAAIIATGETAPTGANAWSVIPEDSALTFTLTYQNKALAGTIDAWSADIVFDPDELDSASAEVVIDARSITTSDSYVNGLIPGSDGLQASEHPQVRFSAKAFRETGPNAYEADADITLRGVTGTAVFPFTLSIEDDVATMTGTLEFSRFEFELGQRNDPNAAYLGPDVSVRAQVRAVRAAP